MAQEPRDYTDFWDKVNYGTPQAPVADPLAPPPKLKEEDLRWWEYGTDVLGGVARGVAGAAEGILEIGNIIPGVEYDIADNFGLGESRTFVGNMADSIVNFAVGFAVPGIGGASLGLRAAAAASKAKKAVGLSKTARTAAELKKAAKAGELSKKAKIGLTTVQSGFTDHLFFKGHEGRLADLVNEYPMLSNPISEFLATDPADSEAEGRFKNFLEGVLIGLQMEAVFIGVKAFRKYKKVAEDTGDLNKAQVEAEQVAQETSEQLEQQRLFDEDAEALPPVEDAGVPRVDEVEPDGLEDLTRAELQAQAKEAGIKANQKSADIIEQLRAQRAGQVDDGLEELTRAELQAKAKEAGIKANQKSAAIIEQLRAKEVDAPKAEAPTPEAPRAEAPTLDAPTAEGVARSAPRAAWDNLSSAEKSAFKDEVESLDVEFFDDKAYDLGLIWAYAGDPANPGRLTRDMDVRDLITQTVRELEIQGQTGQKTTSAMDRADAEQTATLFGDIIPGLDFDSLHKMLADETGRFREVRVRMMAIRKVTTAMMHDYKKQLFELRSKRRAGEAISAEELESVIIAEKRVGALLSTVSDANSQFGRGLADLNSIPRSFLELPESGQFIRGGEADAKDLAALRKQLNKGKFDAEKWLDQRIHAVDAGDMAAMRIAHAGSTKTLPQVLSEVIYNSYLSGPRSQSVNLLGSLTNLFFIPLERAIGHSLRGDRKAITEVKVMLEQHMQMRDALKLGYVAYRQGSPQLDTAGRGTVDVDGSIRGKTSITETLAGPALDDSNKALREMIDWVWNRTNMFTRAMGGTDEIFKQVVYRARVMANLWEQAMNNKALGTVEMKAEWIQKNFEIMTANGQFYSEGRTLSLAFKRAEEILRKENPDIEPAKTDIRRLGREMFEGTGRFASHGPMWDEGLGGIAQRALDAARETTFTTRNAAENANNPLSRGLQRLGEKGQKVLTQSAHPWIRSLVVPFINTPTNLLTFFLDRTAGVPFEAYRMAKYGVREQMVKRMGKVEAEKLIEDNKVLKRMFDEFSEEVFSSPEARAQAIGKMVTGSAIMASVGIAAAEGVITGGGPKDYEQRKLWMDAGHQPYSIKVGDKYYSYRRLDPWATFLGISADLMEIEQNTYGELSDAESNEIGSLAKATALAMFRNLGEKSYLQGAIRLAGALAAPEREAESWLEGAVGVGVPNLFNQLNDDPYLREIESLTDKLKSRTPGLSDTLAPRRNIFGEKIEKPSYAGSGIFEALSPFAYSEVENDIVKEELIRVQHNFSPPRSIKEGMIDLRQFENARGQSAYDRWQELHGSVVIKGRTLKEELERLIQSADYQRMLDSSDSGLNPKVDELKKVLRKYRARAYKQLLVEYPELNAAENQTRAEKQARREGYSMDAILNY